jgi:hypothetical protein
MQFWQAPWYAALQPAIGQIGVLACKDRWSDCLVLLNREAHALGLRNANGLPLSFVNSAVLPEVVYEQHIWQTGQVPTRLDRSGAWHDLFNALTWLAFGRSKARLNALQAAQIDADGIGAQRGGLRDAATLFDENAALFVTSEASLVDALRAFDWQELFVRRRAEFVRNVQVVAFGHALVDKLRQPFKSICAHAWVLPVPAPMLDRFQCGQSPAQLPLRAQLDEALADSLTDQGLRSNVFSPLPVLGIPGWWAANADPDFYDDVTVFRPGRRVSG